jgi:NADPH:quinone reductase
LANKQDITMPKVLVSTVINAPIERVWRTASDFNGLPAWMPGMKDSTIEDNKPPNVVGAVRRLGMAGTKDILRERLELLDADNYRITYSVLEGPLPVKKIVTSMHLRPITDSYGTLGEWSTQFETEPGKEAEGEVFMTRVFGAGFRALKKYLNV